MRLLQVIFITVFGFSIVQCKRYEIRWQSNSESFRHPETMNYRQFRIGDTINFVCPANDEVSAIHRVETEEAATTCRLPNGLDNTTVANCVKPNDVITIRLHAFSPNPAAFEYRPNREYYFISTSTGKMEGLKNRVGGLCKTRNMRIHFVVREKPTKEEEVLHRGGEQSSDIQSHSDPGIQTIAPPFDAHSSFVMPDLPNHSKNEDDRSKYMFITQLSASSEDGSAEPRRLQPAPLSPFLSSSKDSRAPYITGARLGSQSISESEYRRQQLTVVEERGRYDYDFVIGYEIVDYGSGGCGRSRGQWLPVVLLIVTVNIWRILFKS